MRLKGDGESLQAATQFSLAHVFTPLLGSTSCSSANCLNQMRVGSKPQHRCTVSFFWMAMSIVGHNSRPRIDHEGKCMTPSCKPENTKETQAPQISAHQQNPFESTNHKSCLDPPNDGTEFEKFPQTLIHHALARREVPYCYPQ